jgi:hypothetical protein
MPFNNGKPYHGSMEVFGGKLVGKTGKTDYFFFLCPRCNNGNVMRVLEYERRETVPLSDRGEKTRPKENLNLAFHLHCTVCDFEDFIKIDNNHQRGRVADAHIS